MNVLFLTHRLPYAPNRGDRIRAYYLLREMSTFADVSLFSLVHDDEEASHAAEVPFVSDVATSRVRPFRNRIRGALRLATARPLTHSLLDAADARAQIERLVASRRPDIVLAYCSSMARFAIEPPLDRFPLVVDIVDVDSEKWRTMAERSAMPLRSIYRREARTLAAFERTASERAAAALVISEQERESLQAIAPSARIHVIPNGVEVQEFAPPADGPAREPTVVFCGVMNYAPNVEGVRWFADRVWPRVRAERPDARFVIVGAHPAPAITALADRDGSITVTGRVDDVRPYLWRAAVSVAPLHVARGLQNKVLEALAAGLPAVVTSPVRNGLPAIVKPACVVADDSAEFGDATIELLGRTGERRALDSADVLSWSSQLREVRSILENSV
jgi:sugar transferase (PEP-CTERM/EpsH1 system associated)